MLNKNLKKLTYRLQYRGIKELDILFGHLIHNLNSFSFQELKTLEKFLNESENDLYDGILGYKEFPKEYTLLIKNVTDSIRKG